jgi:hypothetical protein
LGAVRVATFALLTLTKLSAAKLACLVPHRQQHPRSDEDLTGLRFVAKARGNVDLLREA